MACEQPISARLEPVFDSRSVQPLIPRVHLPVLLAGPDPSGSTGPSRRCRGCLPPSPVSPGSGCPQFHPAAATIAWCRSSTSTRLNSASRRWMLRVNAQNAAYELRKGGTVPWLVGSSHGSFGASNLFRADHSGGTTGVVDHRADHSAERLWRRPGVNFARAACHTGRWRRSTPRCWFGFRIVLLRREVEL